MNKSPAFQFYPKDVLSDGNAMAMPAEAFGIYMKLLCYDWIDNGLLKDDKTLMRLGGFEWHDFQGNQREPEDYDIILSYLRAQFIDHPTKEGFITNPRLLKERANQAERSASAKSSAEARWKNKDTNANAMRTHDKRNANEVRSVCSSSSTASAKEDSIKDNTIFKKKPAVSKKEPMIKYGENYLQMTASEWDSICLKFEQKQVEIQLSRADLWISKAQTGNASKYRRPAHNHFLFFTQWLERNIQPVGGHTNTTPRMVNTLKYSNTEQNIENLFGVETRQQIFGPGEAKTPDFFETTATKGNEI